MALATDARTLDDGGEMRRAAVHLLVLLSVLAACSGGGSGNPTVTPTSVGTATPGTTASVQPTPVRQATFILHLTAPVDGTTAFQLYLQTDPATMGQDLIELCGPFEWSLKPCDPAGSPFWYAAGPWDIGTTLVYRFERFDGEKAHVFSDGREVFDGSLTVEATYP